MSPTSQGLTDVPFNYTSDLSPLHFTCTTPVHDPPVVNSNPWLSSHCRPLTDPIRYTERWQGSSGGYETGSANYRPGPNVAHGLFVSRL